MTFARITFLLLSLFALAPVAAQKVLQLERAHRARTVKMPIGQTITFRLDEPDAMWEKAEITDLDVDGQRVKLDLLWYATSDIATLKWSRNGAVRGLGGMLGVFGISWVGYSAIGEFLYNDKDVSWKAAAIIAGVTIPAGLLMTSPRFLKMGKKYRLRVLDVTYPGTESRY